jgi:hypothetical protein
MKTTNPQAEAKRIEIRNKIQGVTPASIAALAASLKRGNSLINQITNK